MKENFVTITFGELPIPQQNPNEFGFVFGLTGNFGIAQTSMTLHSLLLSFQM